MTLQATTNSSDSSQSLEAYVPTGTDEDEFELQRERVHATGLGDLVSYDDDFDVSGLIRRDSAS
jgi:hypothetical protein